MEFGSAIFHHHTSNAILTIPSLPLFKWVCPHYRLEFLGIWWFNSFIVTAFVTIDVSTSIRSQWAAVSSVGYC